MKVRMERRDAGRHRAFRATQHAGRKDASMEDEWTGEQQRIVTACMKSKGTIRMGRRDAGGRT